MRLKTKRMWHLGAIRKLYTNPSIATRLGNSEVSGEKWDVLSFKAYNSWLVVIDQALETAPLMLGSDLARGYRLQMICADFLAGASQAAFPLWQNFAGPHS
jgi:hypothetical protein